MRTQNEQEIRHTGTDDKTQWTFVANKQLEFPRKLRNYLRYKRQYRRRGYARRQQGVERWEPIYSLHDSQYCEFARRLMLDIYNGVFQSGALDGKRVELIKRSC
jgi:hypothetical protein